MQFINTSLTRLLNIRVPVISAPMFGAVTAKLAIEVTRAGAFGFIPPPDYYSVENLRGEIDIARTAFPDLSKPIPIGVGYLGWWLDKVQSRGEALLDVALERNVQAIWLAFGADLGRWIKYVRTKKFPGSRTPLIFVQVASIKEALVAINEWKVDVVVAQGIESGGHGGSAAPSTFSFVSSILSSVPRNACPPIVAAGGLANGAQVAALLSLGASGALFGTRFLLTPESTYTDVSKSALLSAGPDSTVRTMAFDIARDQLGWPEGIDGRALRNKTVEDMDNGVDVETFRKKYVEAMKNRDPERMSIWSGEGVHLMNNIMSAKAVVEEIHQELIQTLVVSRSLLSKM